MTRRRWAHRAAAPLLAAALALGACAYNQSAGRYEFSLVSAAQEAALGKQSDQAILAQFGVYGQQRLDDYVTRVGRKVAAQTGVTAAWTFRLLDSPVVNAFALPGGYIYVTRGMLAHMQNEAQLATVLGHELAHVTARHTAQKITREQLTGIGLGLGAILFQEIRPYLGILQAGAQLFFLRYSRDDEREADQLGVDYAMAAGYAADEGAEVFNTLDTLQREQGVMLPSWAATHPDPAERAKTLRVLAADYRRAHPGGKYAGTAVNPFLARLDRLVYGENPRQGFVKHGVFYHPDMRFQFPVPTGWNVQNLASRVVMVPPGANPDAALVMLGATGITLEAAVQAFSKENQGQVVSSAKTAVNGLPAYVLVSRIPSQDPRRGRATLAVMSTFIGLGDRIFALHGQTSAANFGAYDDVFKQVMTNFKRLTDSTVLATEPVRIRTFKAPRTDEFKDLVDPAPRAGADKKELAVINQCELHERVLAGTLIKNLH